jgi:hypothetical protein
VNKTIDELRQMFGPADDQTPTLTDDQKERLLDHLRRVLAWVEGHPDDWGLDADLKAEADALVEEIGEDAYDWYADGYEDQDAGPSTDIMPVIHAATRQQGFGIARETLLLRVRRSMVQMMKPYPDACEAITDAATLNDLHRIFIVGLGFEEAHWQLFLLHAVCPDLQDADVRWLIREGGQR